MNTKALLEPMGSWAWWRSWFLIFLGCSVMGAGFVLFVNPYKFVPGGVYGMGIVLHNIFLRSRSVRSVTCSTFR